MALNYAFKLTLSFCFVFIYLNGYGQNFRGVEISARRKAHFQALINRNKAIVAFIENTLVENNLPKMLRNLSLIESGFDKNVVSSAKAGGIWQLMDEHAAQYGLKSEQRFDVYHSTQTAVKSLKHLYQIYGNWITVVAAYNCGEGNIKKAMDKAKSNQYEKFYTYLPSETINHVYYFIQACTVTNELNYLMADYKFSTSKMPKRVMEQTTSKKDKMLVSTDINAAFNLDVIAEEMNVTAVDFYKWNPTIKDELVNNGTAELYLPIDKMPDFILLKNLILNRSLQTATTYDK